MSVWEHAEARHFAQRTGSDWQFSPRAVSKSSSINRCEHALRKVCGGCLEVMAEMAWQYFGLRPRSMLST
jgi:hypothetical protein